MKNNKKLILVTGFACNNNCLMCSLQASKQAKINRTTQQLILDIEQGRKNGFEKIEFTGGEPAIRKDIFQLIKYARAKGFKDIAISTNGRMFFYPDVCGMFVESGLSRIYFSLHGHTPKLHDAITRTPGSFEKIVSGIKNMFNYSTVEINISTLILRLNYKYLKEMSYFMFETFGIKNWLLLDLIPEGNSLPLYKGLAVRIADLSKAFCGLPSALPDKACVSLVDFPLCIFPKHIRNSNYFYFITAKEKNKLTAQSNYGATRISKAKDTYSDKYKIKLTICGKCSYRDSCAGIWKRYIELYGGDEIKELAEKNDVLNNGLIN